MTGNSVHSRWKANYERFYQDDVAEWRRIGSIDKVRNITRLCGKHAPARVLEVGCGDGSILARMSEVGFGEALHGVDISSTGVAKANARGIPRLVGCQVYDGQTFPFEDDAFDLVVLTHVVEHLEYPRAVLYEAARVAKRVFIEVPLEDTIRMPRDFVADAVGHINFYSPATIRRLVQTCELRVVEQVVTNFSLPGYTFNGGLKAVPKFLLKEGLLRFAPKLAPRLYTYNSALLCERA